jgi:hypothetical protein
MRLYGARWNAGLWRIYSRFNSERYFTTVRFVRGDKTISFRMTEPQD